MLTLIKRLLEDTKADNLSEVWSELEVFFHGGISFAPYREEYKRLIPSPRMQYRETYNASEGFFGIQDDPNDPAMLLMLDYGIYYEFIPLAELDSPTPKAIPLVEVEVGKTYALVISTLGGLYRYIIGDTIRFTQRNPYKFIIVGRTTSYINAFGEELMVCNADEALARVSSEQQATITEYTAAPYFDASTGKGRHDWLIEFDQAPQDLALFAQRLHEELRKINSDYEAKSSPGMTLQPLEIRAVPKGSFERYLKEKGKLGGQNKIPRLRNDRELYNAILQLSGIA
jgi:GH3 auxin-responsive promoter.